MTRSLLALLGFGLLAVSLTVAALSGAGGHTILIWR